MLGTKGSHNNNSDTALEVPVPTLSPFLLGWEEVRHRETGVTLQHKRGEIRLCDGQGLCSGLQSKALANAGLHDTPSSYPAQPVSFQHNTEAHFCASLLLLCIQICRENFQ